MNFQKYSGVLLVMLSCACPQSSSNTDCPTGAAPRVTTTSPADGELGVQRNTFVTAHFSNVMDAQMITNTTFLLKQGATVIPGSVDYSDSGARFSPAAPFEPNAVLTATITAGIKDVDGRALESDHTWTFSTGAGQGDEPPTVTATLPISDATAVAANATVRAVFSEPMAAATLNSLTFTLKRGTTPVLGTVAYAGGAATFTPAAALEDNAVFTATITTGAMDTGNHPMLAPYVWSFSTSAAVQDGGTTADAGHTSDAGTLADAGHTPDAGALVDAGHSPDAGNTADAGQAADAGVPAAPTVLTNVPAAGAMSVASNTLISATFSVPMNPTTLNATSFTLMAGAAVVPGTVSYTNATARFLPTAPLAINTSFTAAITTGARSAAGVALAAAHSWTFSTGNVASLGVNLGTAGGFAILAKSAVTTVPGSMVTGDVGVSPAAATYITGFSLIADASNVFSTSSQVTGHVYAADYAPPTPANMTTAVSDMELAFTDAAARAADVTELGAGDISGLTLAHGVYKWGSGLLISSDLTLTGSATDVWILQIAQDLTLANATNVHLAGGALAKNVFWQVSGRADLGTTSHMEGNILSQTSITLATGATANGRLLAQTAVGIDASTVARPAP